MEVLFLVWLVSGIVCLMLASNKGKNVGLAFVMGAVFGVFAIAYYVLAPKNPTS